MNPGAFGVNLTDTRNPPRFFVLSDHPVRMGIGLFIPLDDPGALVAFPVRDFWHLV